MYLRAGRLCGKTVLLHICVAVTLILQGVLSDLSMYISRGTWVCIYFIAKENSWNVSHKGPPGN